MTALVWNGKYKDGKKLSPTHLALPFQTLETVSELDHGRQLTLDLFATGRPPDWGNHTYGQSGSYTVVIKVIDLFGNDTTKAIRVEVK